MTETPFRIGGVYRDQGGQVTRLDTPLEDGTADGLMLSGNFTGSRSGPRNLSDGRYPGYASQADSIWHLLPGELHQINGEWVPRGVPVEDKPAVYERERVSEHKTIVKRVPRSGVNYGPPTKERTRPALDWADSKRVDRFPGFVVESGAVKHDEYNPPERVLHPLQRIAQEGDQLHGSAFLRKGA
jgi:hypothetical protein